MLNRLALAFAALLLLPALVIGLAPAHVPISDESCGNWVLPRFTALKVAMQEADLAMGGDGPNPRLVQAMCDDKLDTRRNVSLVLLFLGVGVPCAIWFVGYPVASRRRDSARV